MPKLPLVPFAAALSLSALTLTACGGGGGAPTTAAGSQALAPAEAGRCTEDKAGGTITMGEYVMLPSFAPGQGQYGVRGSAQSAAVYDRLMRWDPAAEEFEPKLAESLQPSDDNTVWTLTLRDGVNFSNGDPLTAEDVVFTIDLNKDPRTKSVAQTDAMQIKQARVIDPLTVEFTLTGPWVGFPSLLAGVVGEVIPKQAYQEAGPEKWARSPIGAGAFVLDRYVPDQEVVLSPNPDYYGGPVCPTLRFTRISGSQGTYEAFQTGELQIGFLRGAQYVTNAQADGVRGFEEILSPGTVVMMNAGTAGYDGVFTDERARRAVAHAIDRDLMDQRIHDGTGLPATTLLPETSRFFDGQTGPAYDPELASDLIEQVRADNPHWDGTITLLAPDSPENVEFAVTAKAMLDAVGFDVTIANAPVSQVNARQFTGDFELAVGGSTVLEADPASSMLGMFTPDGATNLSGIDDPELTSAVMEFMGANQLDAQQAAYDRVQQAYNRTVPFATVYNVPQYLIVDDSIKNAVPTLSSTVLFDGAYVEK